MNLKSLFLFLTVASVSILLGANDCSGFQVENLKSSALVYPTINPMEGRVVDDSGWPIAGAVVVQFLDSENRPANAVLPPINVCNSARTDVRGKFKLSEIDHRFAFLFSVYHPDYLVRTLPPIETMGDIALTKPTLVSGRLTHHDGMPAKDYLINLGTAPGKDVIGFEYRNIRTDSEGRFTLPTAYDYAEFFVSKPDQFSIPFQWRKTKPETAGNPSDEILVYGDEIDARLPKPYSIEISVVSAATGGPVPLEYAALKHSHWATSLSYEFRRTKLKAKNNSVAVDYLREGINRIWIFPKSETNHLACFVDIEINSESPNDQKLELKTLPGVVVSGSVIDESTGHPIADAAVQYLSMEPGSLLKQGILIPKFVRTDKNGKYSLVAPAAPAILQVVGDCKNYQTLPIENKRIVQSQSSIPDEISDRLEREITPDEVKSLTVSAFQLSKSPVVSGNVVDENDKPLANVAFVLDRDYDMKDRTWVFGQTNQRGEFTVDNVFTNAMREHTTSRPSTRKQNTLFFWHKDSSAGKLAELKEAELIGNDFTLKVKLQPTPAAWGSVIDKLSKEPIAGVKLSVQTQWGGGLLAVGATSREDGTFLIEHLPRKRARIHLKKRDYNNGTASITFDAANSDQLVLELEDIEMIKTYAYGKPGKPETVDSFNPKQTLESAISYITQELNKIPGQKRDGSWGPNDPDYLFRKLLAENLNDHAAKLFSSDVDQSFQTSAALALLDAFAQRDTKASLPKVPALEQARQILLNNIETAGVSQKLLKYEFPWGYDELRIRVARNSPNDEMRMYALTYLLSKTPSDIDSGLRVDQFRSDDKSFSKTLELSIELWKTSIDEFGDQTVPGMDRNFSAYVNQNFSTLERKLAAPNLDETRAKIVREAIETFTNKN